MNVFEATIVVTRYKEPNALLFDTLDSLSLQEGVKLEILVLDQFYNQLTLDYCTKFSSKNHIFLYIVIDPISLSYARNYGLTHAKNNFVIFIDSDAIARKNWSFEIIKLFNTDNGIKVIGTKILPKWNGKKSILTKSSLFSAVYSLLDNGDGNEETNKVIGASFAVNKKDIENIRFDENLGRKNGILLGGEETDFCDQVKSKGYKIYYTGKTHVLHQINADRLSYKGLIERVIFQGVGRALKGGKPNPNKSKRNLYDYLFFPIFILFYGYGYILGIVKYKKGEV